MAPGTSRKIAIAALAILTIGLGAVAVMISLDLFNQGGNTTPPPASSSSSTNTVPPNVLPPGSSSSTSSDNPVEGGTSCCGAGYCDANNNGQQDAGEFAFGGDNNYNGTCDQRRAAVSCAGTVRGSDPIACPSSTTSQSTSNSNQSCQPIVSGNSVTVPDGCGQYSVFTGTRRMTGPSDQCFVTGSPNSTRTAGFTLTAQASRCFCQQVDVIWNGQTYGASAIGGWDASCTGGSSSSSNSTPSSSSSSSTATSQAADITVAKESAISSCSETGSTAVNYTVTVRNLGSSPATIDDVIDTLETPINSTHISNISNSGNSNGPIITWTGPFNIPANGSITFTYTVTVSASLREALGNDIENIVEANFGSSTRSFTHLTSLSCLPNTGLFDEDGRPLLIGLILILMGLLVNRSQYIMNWMGKRDDEPEYVQVEQISRSQQRKSKNDKFESNVLSNN